MINKDTIISVFNERGTLVNALKTVNEALNEAVLTSVEIVNQTATSCQIKFNFADDTSITSGIIDLKGAQGDASTIAVGTVTTLDAGQEATVTNSGTASNAVLNFGIPKGTKGDTGEAGGITNIDGYTGAVTTGDGIAFSNGALSSYDFNLTNAGALNPATTSIFSNIYSALYKALNADATIGKIYGYAGISIGTISADNMYYLPLGVTVDTPDVSYDILNGGILIPNDYSVEPIVTHFFIDTNGEVSLGGYFTTACSNKRFYVFLPASIYFFRDFGDTPNREMVRSNLTMSSERIINPEILERT